MTEPLSSPASHGAGASAIGYLYQVERALLELILRANEALTLYMERVDDFELEATGSPREILQVKHHAGRGADLSDMSVDLWRSLGVWLDLLPAGGQAQFVLLTTSSLPSNGAAHLLQEEGRDVPAALKLLEEAAANSTNQQTSLVRIKFLELSSDQRLEFLLAVQIRGSETEIGEIDEAMKDALRLRLNLPEANHSVFLDRLRAWWYRVAVRMLASPTQGISTDDLVRFLQMLRDSFHPEDLPLSIDFEDPTDIERHSYEASIFVTQLIWIAYTNDQLNIAIRDYHRAFTERSRWAREGILRPGEIEGYERRLVEQWQRVFADMRGDVATDASDAESERAGRGLLRELRDSTAVLLRPRYNEVFMTHGSLHLLSADGRVGWHPDFQARLEALLAGAAS